MIMAVGDLPWQPRGPGPYTGKSASSRDPEWPVWMVIGSAGTNVLTLPKDHPAYGCVLTNKSTAIALADRWNADVDAVALQSPPEADPQASEGRRSKAHQGNASEEPKAS